MKLRLNENSPRTRSPNLSPRSTTWKVSSPSLLSTRVTHSLRSSKSTPRVTHALTLPSPPRSPDPLPQSPRSVYPEWLESRKDFADVKQRFQRMDAIDCYQVCQKPVMLRSHLERKAVARVVQLCPFFSSMKEAQLMDVTECMHSISFLKGEVLMAKGEAADCLYMILSGRVGVYICDTHCVDEVIQGNVVGESAIQTRTPRSATVLAHEDVKTLRLAYEDFDQVLYRLKLHDYFDVANFLRKVEFFADWHPSKLYRLASVMMVKQYRREQRVFHRGEPPHDIYIVRDGLVRLSMALDVKKFNRWPVSPRKWAVQTTTQVFDATLKVCKAGDFFGAEELIDGMPLRSTAVCDSETVLLFIIREEFFQEIFSDKDRKALSSASYRRPQTQNLRYRLEAEKNKEKVTADALLDAIDTNALPVGRDLFSSPAVRRRMEWARQLERRKRIEIRRGLLKQTVSQEEASS